ncbi:DUF3800 domain-containing protein [Lysinibacillus telephonicus]|uniref:DUF3800 domain-containing protein n=1 Tax=Lysinibacillus telephonicus TaxID=1714840 RepID=UPI003BA124A8
MFNIYCDESCHLPHDSSNVMVLGSIKINEKDKQKFNEDIRELKIKHGMSSWNEIKWTKVSNSKIEFYFDLIDWFFENNLKFRALVAKNKKELNHDKYSNGDYDLWYYKMYFRLLDPLLEWGNEYKTFIDIKDTKGGQRVEKLREVLCNNMYDFNGTVLKDVKQIVSSHSEILQLCDLLIGCISYYHRGLYDSGSETGKNKLISYLINHHNRDLNKSTYKSERKFNLFIWQPEGVR